MLHQVHHGKQRITVFLDLGPLVAVLGVFHREWMQVEFMLHLGQLSGLGVLQRDPDKAVGARDVVADFGDGDVGQLGAVLVGHAVDEHGRLFVDEGSGMYAFWHAANPTSAHHPCAVSARDPFQQMPWNRLCRATGIAPCKGGGVAERSPRSLGVSQSCAPLGDAGLQVHPQRPAGHTT